MFTLPDLPYSHEALEPFVDAETMHIHHDMHHAAYIKNLNDVLGSTELSQKPIVKILSDTRIIPENIRMKIINFGGGHMNHSFFWQCMSADRDQTIEGNLKNAIDKTFGNMVGFIDQFTKTALGQFGSGWAWLVSDHGDLLIESTSNQDTPVSKGKIPLLTLDVWEHAYYLKYRQARADYITAWWHVVNWKFVSDTYKTSMK